MTPHWKAVIGVVLIFIFGFLSGIVCTSIVAQRKIAAFYQHPAVSLSEIMEKRLTKNLDLDANQKQQVHQYFVENLDHRKQIQQGIQPQVQMLNLETFRQINVILRPDQRDRFHQNILGMRKRFPRNPLNPNASVPDLPGFDDQPNLAPVTNSVPSGQ